MRGYPYFFHPASRFPPFSVLIFSHPSHPRISVGLALKYSPTHVSPKSLSVSLYQRERMTVQTV